MTAPVTNDDDLGVRLVGALLFAVLAVLCVLAAIGPEPALQPTPVTPATASQAVPFDGSTR